MTTFRTIKATSVITDDYAFLTAYTTKNILHNRIPVKLVSRPACSIDMMSPDDAYIFQVHGSSHDGKIIELRVHQMSGPKFLIGKYKKSTGKICNFRAKFEVATNTGNALVPVPGFLDVQEGLEEQGGDRFNGMAEAMAAKPLCLPSPVITPEAKKLTFAERMAEARAKKKKEREEAMMA